MISHAPQSGAANSSPGHIKTYILILLLLTIPRAPLFLRRGEGLYWKPPCPFSETESRLWTHLKTPYLSRDNTRIAYTLNEITRHEGRGV